MSTTTSSLDQSLSPIAATVPADSSVSTQSLELRQLQRQLLRAVSSSSDQQALLSVIGILAVESVSPSAIQYYHRDDQRHLSLGWQLSGGQNSEQAVDTERHLLALSARACKQGSLQVKETPGMGRALSLSVPVFLHNRPPEALAITLPYASDSLERVIAVLQLFASHITLWQLLQVHHRSESEAQTGAALLEIFTKVECCESFAEAGYTLASALKTFVDCDRVAIGLCHGSESRCRLLAFSEHAKFDRNSELARNVTAALNEAVLRGTLSSWSKDDQQHHHATRALHRLATHGAAHAAISAPLTNEAGETTGAWLFLGDKQLPEEAANVISASAIPISTFLKLAERSQQGPIAQLSSKLHKLPKSWRGRSLAAAAGLLVAILCLPLPYKIQCDSKLQPVIRRYVAAPFDGRLEKAFVQTGAIVQQGSLLARMEGRDLRSELAGVEADLQQAMKKRDSALATGDIVTAQISRLEVERLNQKVKLLERRFEHLEIKSPISGVVITGDQERAEGAPLTVGQGLFEVAPLDEMVVEVALPEDEVFHVRADMPVTIRLDAFPRKQWEGVIGKVHPRSETIDDQNVFVAEVILENADGLLRPGMNGQARIRGDRHTVAWNWFHKPWHMILSGLGM